MKILHTGDWHLNDRLGRIDRSDDILANLRRIAAYLEEHAVDVMIVAGDLFCDRSTKDDLRRAVGQIEEIFSSFLRRNGTIVAVAGNHDSDIFLETLRRAIALAPGQPGPDGTDSTGRLYIFEKPGMVSLTDREGSVVQFLLMPYPKAQWLRLAEGEEGGGAALHHRGMRDTYTRYLQQVMNGARFRKDRHTVLVSHLLVRGVTTGAGFRMTEEQDVCFEESDLPAGFAYVALGHIHQAQQAVGGAPWVRYSGSIERLDYGERKDEKSVALFEVGPNGRITDEPTLLPLPCTPMERFIFGENGADPEAEITALEEARRDQADREQQLVHYALHYVPGRHSPETLRRRLHTLFPRWYRGDLIPVRVGEDGSALPPPEDISSVEKTACAYIERAVSDTEQRRDLLRTLDLLLRYPDQTPEELVDAWEAEEAAAREAADGTNAPTAKMEVMN
jgi:exonuclease SbcD